MVSPFSGYNYLCRLVLVQLSSILAIFIRKQPILSHQISESTTSDPSKESLPCTHQATQITTDSTYCSAESGQKFFFQTRFLYSKLFASGYGHESHVRMFLLWYYSDHYNIHDSLRGDLE